MAGQCHCWAGLNLPLEAYANGPAQIRNRNYSKRQRSQSSHDRKADQKDNPNAVVAYYVIQEKEDNEERERDAETDLKPIRLQNIRLCII